MRIVKCIIFIIILLNQPAAHAQPVTSLNAIEMAYKNHNREEVNRLYLQVSENLSPGKTGQPEFTRFIKISHELSSSGYAKTVISGLAENIHQNQLAAKRHRGVYTSLLTELGYAYFYDFQYAKADSVLQKALFIQQQSPKTPPLKFAYTCNLLGYIHRQLGNYDQAIDYFEKAKAIRIKELGEDNPLVGSIYNNLGLVYKNRYEFDKALANFEKAVEIKNKSNDSTVYNNYVNIGALLSMLGNYSLALEYYEKAEKVLQNLDDQEKLADLYSNMGVAYNYLRASKESYEYHQKALTIYTAALGSKSEKISNVYQNLANVFDELGDRPNEQKAIEKALALDESIYGDGNPELAPLYNNLGLLYRDNGVFGKSLEYLNQAKRIYQQSANKQPEKYLNTISNIGETYRMMNVPDSAISYFQEALLNQRKLYGGKHPYLAFSCNKLAEIYYSQKKYELADSFIEQAFAANISVDKPGGVPVGFDPSYLFESYLCQGKIFTPVRNWPKKRAEM